MDVLNLDETNIPSEEDFLRQAGLTDKEIADWKIGKWLSSALSDPGVCLEFKQDINAWFKVDETVQAIEKAGKALNL